MVGGVGVKVACCVGAGVDLDEDPRSRVAMDSTRCASVMSLRLRMYFICFFTLGICAIAYNALNELVDEFCELNGFKLCGGDSSPLDGYSVPIDGADVRI